MGDESKHELFLKRAQLVIGVLAGLTTLIVGGYNVRNIFFKKPEPVVAAPTPPAHQSDAIRSAVEEVGASWIKKLGTPKSDK